MQNTKKTKLEYTIDLLKEENGGQVGTSLDFAAVANAMPATQEKAPYLIHPIMGESAEFDEFVSEMLAEAGQGTITEARYYANVIDEVLEKLLADGKTSIDTGWFTAAPAINGSVPYCNSEPTEENFVYIALLPCLDTRKLVAMMPLASTASDKAFDIKEVFDVATNKPWIVAGLPFYVFGQSFSDDTTAVLIGADGVEHPCTSPVTDKIPTRLTFTAPAGLEAGTYTLALTGKGRGETPVMLTKPNVTVKAGEPVPTIDKVATEGAEGIVKGEAFAATGSHLSYGEGDSVTVKWTEDGVEKLLVVTPSNTAPAKMDFDWDAGLADIPDNTELTFVFSLGGAALNKGSKMLPNA